MRDFLSRNNNDNTAVGLKSLTQTVLDWSAHFIQHIVMYPGRINMNSNRQEISYLDKNEMLQRQAIIATINCNIFQFICEESDIHELSVADVLEEHMKGLLRIIKKTHDAPTAAQFLAKITTNDQ